MAWTLTVGLTLVLPAVVLIRLALHVLGVL